MCITTLPIYDTVLFKVAMTIAMSKEKLTGQPRSPEGTLLYWNEPNPGMVKTVPGLPK